MSELTKVIQEQAEQLCIPFEARVHPQAATAEVLGRQWAVELGLLVTERARTRYDSARFSRLNSLTNPIGSFQSLLVANDWTTWLFMHDDQCDEASMKNQPDSLRKYHDKLLKHLAESAKPQSSRDPLTNALLDIVDRGTSLGGKSWQERFVRRVREYFEGCQWEAANRLRGRVPGKEEYVLGRDRASAVHTCLVCGELAADVAWLPEATRNHLALRRMGLLTNRVVSWINDIYSLEKELARSDVHNLVIVLRHREQVDWLSALASTVSWINQCATEFISLEADFDSLSGTTHDAVQRLFLLYRSWMRGNWEWSKETMRYRNESIVPPGGRLTYLERIMHTPSGGDSGRPGCAPSPIRTPSPQRLTPRRPPQTGLLWMLRTLRDVVRGDMTFLFDGWKRYGDFYVLDLGLLKPVIVAHPDVIEAVLRDRAGNYRKGGAMWDSVRTLMGNGLVTSEGDLWRRQRRAIQPHFGRRSLPGLAALMSATIADDFDRNWPRPCSDLPVQVADAFSRMTMKVVMRSIFGSRMEESDAEEMSVVMTFVMHHLVHDMVLHMLPPWVLRKTRKTYRGALTRFDEYLFRLIKERRGAPSNGDDLLSALCRDIDVDTGAAMSNRQIRDEVATFFAAGYDTTANGVCWASYLLAQHDDVQDRVRKEVDTVLRGQTPDYGAVQALRYTQKAFKESLRMYPPSFFVPRTATVAHRLGGYDVSAGQMLFLLPLLGHRHNDFWPEPERFDPERFTDERRAPPGWLPFGAGQRHCIGREFAMTEGTLILANLVQRYRLTTWPARPAKIGLSTTLRGKDGVWLRLTAR